MRRFEQEVALVADYKKGMRWKDLQDKYNCSVTTIYGVLVRNNINRKREESKSWSIDKQELFKKMYLSNCTYPELEAKFGIASSSVTRWAHKLNLPMRGSGRNNTWPNKFADQTHEANYWLGYVLADGHITNSERTGRISLYTKEQYVVEKFKEWFGNGVRVYSRPYMTDGGKEQTFFTITVGGKHISEWMRDAVGLKGCKHHTLNPKVELNWDILRGYFDGDGSMSAERYLSMKSCSKIWLERIQAFLQQYGIKSTVRLSYRDCYGLFVYEYEGLKSILNLMYNYPYYCHEYKHTNLVNRVAAMQRRKSGELLEA